MADGTTGNERPLVMVVEDEFLILLNTLEDLAEIGYWTVEASSGAEALRAADVARLSLQVAVVDLGLPDKPGEEVAEELRRMVPGLRILFATGNADRDLRQRYVDDRHVGFLDKPYTGKMLVEHLVRLGVPPAKR